MIERLLCHIRPLGRRSQRGFTLLETMLALTIGALVLSTLLGWSVVAMKQQGNVARMTMDGSSVGFLRTIFLRDVASAHDAAVGSDLALAACGPDLTIDRSLLRLTDERGRRIFYATAESRRGSNVSDQRARERAAQGVERESIWRYTCAGGQVLMATELVSDVTHGSAGATCTARPAMPVDDCGTIRLIVALVGGEKGSMAATLRVDADGVAGTDIEPPTFETPEVTIEASPLEVHRGEPVNFNASAFVESGDPLTMRWDLGDGTTVDGASATHTYSELGEFTGVFTATTPAGTPSTDFLRVNVTNRRPEAVVAAPADGTMVNLCTDVTFSGAGSNDADDAPFGGHIVNYQWNFGDGNAKTVTTQATTHRFTEITSDSGEDEIAASLAVEDNDGGVSQAVFTGLTLVNRPPTKPVITAQVGTGPVTNAGGTMAVTLPATVSLKANAVDPDGTCDELTYRWDLGGGATSEDANPTLNLTSGPSRTVKLKVTDKYGAEVTSDPITIQINTPPVATFTMSPTLARTGATVTVTNNSSDAETNAGALTYYWVFQHGNQNASNFTTTARNPGTVKFSHDGATGDTFAPGSGGKAYTVTLTVTDPQGASHTTTRTINITGAPAPTGLKVSGKTASWNAVSAVSKYQLFIENYTCVLWVFCSWNTLGTYETTATSYTASKSDIRFKVRAMDSYSGRWGEWSGTS